MKNVARGIRRIGFLLGVVCALAYLVFGLAISYDSNRRILVGTERLSEAEIQRRIDFKPIESVTWRFFLVPQEATARPDVTIVGETKPPYTDDEIEQLVEEASNRLRSDLERKYRSMKIPKFRRVRFPWDTENLLLVGAGTLGVYFGLWLIPWTLFVFGKRLCHVLSRLSRRTAAGFELRCRRTR